MTHYYLFQPQIFISSKIEPFDRSIYQFIHDMYKNYLFHYIRSFKNIGKSDIYQQTLSLTVNQILIFGIQIIFGGQIIQRSYNITYPKMNQYQQPSPQQPTRNPANSAYPPQQQFVAPAQQRPPASQPNAISKNNQSFPKAYSDNYQEQVGYYSQNTMDEITQNKKVYLAIFCIQIPLTFLNLYFALTSPQSQCMDKAHRLNFIVVRPWFLSMGIIQIVLLIALSILILLYRFRCISREAMKRCQNILLIIACIKILIWFIAELNLFMAEISKYCSGGIYAYGLILTILHCILLIVVLWNSGCQNSDPVEPDYF